ncbi:MAG: ABC transporter substrate-binding protein [Thermohalobaculum sp.]|nr:ABC transporter substrate-binding protein [Thermohalobaculum sp.]
MARHNTRISRRAVVVGGLAVLGAPVAVRAAGLDPALAGLHVEATIDAILKLVVANRPRAETAAALDAVLREKTALPQLAQFAAGRHWRAMSAAQRDAYVDAFARYLSRIYAGYFRAFEGDVEDLRRYVHHVGARDAGAKGVMVATEIRPLDQIAISVEWIVSDRSGRVAISDLVVEGVSLAVTQREIVGAMLERHHGDVEAVIADLDRQAPEAQP